MVHRLILCSAILLSLLSCTRQSIPTDEIDIQGHRGARGIMPENTVEAMIYALKTGVTTLEMDVVITKDHRVILSHEPYMSASICLDSTGMEILPQQDTLHNIYAMPLTKVQQYDCGTLTPGDFPNQHSLPAFKPLLSSVIDTVESYTKAHGIPDVDYNIEIKSTPRGDGIYHPEPSEFADLVMDVIYNSASLNTDQIILQSFDFRVLRYLNATYPKIRLSALEFRDRPVQDTFDELGFVPDVYSPHYRILTSAHVTFAMEHDVMVIPWTINEVDTALRLVQMGVDGIITDYPDRIISAFNSD